MARVKVELPGSFQFTAIIPIRITDINYGGHVGNNTILSVIHEARMQFLHQYGYTEMNLAGVGLIMSDAAIEFKSELFYGDIVRVSVAIVSMSKVAFELCYKLEKGMLASSVVVAVAKTGMLCYNYEKKKITAIPEEVKSKLNI
jgi:acyl-CoA thioester hydrolase